MIRPGLTGYSPFRMCRSVPQIVVKVTRITASPTPAVGRGTSSTRIWFGPRNTLAFIFSMAILRFELLVMQIAFRLISSIGQRNSVLLRNYTHLKESIAQYDAI